MHTLPHPAGYSRRRHILIIFRTYSGHFASISRGLEEHDIFYIIFRDYSLHILSVFHGLGGVWHILTIVQSYSSIILFTIRNMYILKYSGSILSTYGICKNMFRIWCIAHSLGYGLSPSYSSIFQWNMLEYAGLCGLWLGYDWNMIFRLEYSKNMHRIYIRICG